jgi:hypothetical protein
MPRAFSVRCRSLTALTAQPTTNRENKSRMAARYSLPLANHKLGRVADPPPIRRVRRELLIEQIRRDRLIVIAHRGVLEPLPRTGDEMRLLHQADETFATDALILVYEILMNPWTAIPKPTRHQRR